MPIYQYSCDNCGPFNLMKPMAKAAEPAHCPGCATLSRRDIVAPFLGSTARNSINVASRNERARNEPRHSAEHQHSGGCCGSKSSRISGKTLSNGAGDKMFPSMRPWMISH